MESMGSSVLYAVDEGLRPKRPAISCYWFCYISAQDQFAFMTRVVTLVVYVAHTRVTQCRLNNQLSHIVFIHYRPISQLFLVLYIKKLEIWKSKCICLM